MDINGTKHEHFKYVLKTNYEEMKNLMNGKNVRDTEDYFNFLSLQNAAEKLRRQVHEQDILENAVKDTILQRQAILNKMQDHAQLLELKIQRRSKLQENAAKDLQKMEIKQIGEELEYLRNRFYQIQYRG